jgi:hypothetical protein
MGTTRVEILNIDSGLAVEAQNAVKEMSDAYMDQVEATHGLKIRKIIEYIVSTKTFATAVTKSLAISDAEEPIKDLVISMLSDYGGSSIGALIRAYELQPSLEDMQEWADIADRFVQNTEATIERIIGGSKVH